MRKTFPYSLPRIPKRKFLGLAPAVQGYKEQQLTKQNW